MFHNRNPDPLVEHPTERAAPRQVITPRTHVFPDLMEGKLVRVYGKPWKYEYRPYRTNPYKRDNPRG